MYRYSQSQNIGVCMCIYIYMYTRADAQTSRAQRPLGYGLPEKFLMNPKDHLWCRSSRKAVAGHPRPRQLGKLGLVGVSFFPESGEGHLNPAPVMRILQYLAFQR